MHISEVRRRSTSLGRILNPLPARDQIRGAIQQGIGQALHEDLLYDARNGHPLNPGYYGARHLTHVDAPNIEVTFIETDDGLGPFGAKTVGESGIIICSACSGQRDLQRDRASYEGPAYHTGEDSGSTGMKTFANQNARTLDEAVVARSGG